MRWHKSTRVAFVACALLAGCNDTRDLAPESADMPWEIQTHLSTPALAPSASATAPAESRRFDLPRDAALPWHDDAARIETGHIYGLAELIDIAQRHNKNTRIAWEQARQAAIEVGISRAAFLPELTVSALGGYQHIASPFPSNLVRKGYITANTQEIFPELAITYLLLDFGGRKAAEQAAQQLSFAANVAFTGAHQALILTVSRAYFTLDGVNAQLRAARQALANAQLLQQSAEAMQAHGVGTSVNVQLARRATAQAQFDIAAATRSQHDAMYGLLDALSLPPTTKLTVEDSSERPLPLPASRPVEQMIQDALRQRPDLLAGLARLRAADSGVAEARSSFLPRLAMQANVQGNVGRISVDSLPYEGVTQPQVGVFLRFDWPLYAGGLRQNQLRLAQSRRAEADEALQLSSDHAMREVAMAYDEIDTGLSEHQSARALVAASQSAFDAARQSFAHGVGTFTDAVSTQSALTVAESAVARAHAQALIDAASLAFAAGELTSSAAPSLTPDQP